MTTVVLCGMPDEVRVLTNALHPGTLILSGTDKLNLPKLVPDTCTRLVCTGVCGGLAPDLVVPDIALATAVIDHAGTGMPTDPDWNKAATFYAARAGLTLHPVPYYSSGLFDEADTVGQRAAMFKKYGTHAIDDESRYVVAEAVRRKIPFNVVRPLSDDYRDTLPLMARGKIMNPDGSANIPYLFSALGQDQGNGAESVFTVAANYHKSLEALEALAKALASLIAQ
jgi:hypothetical protein